MKVLFVQVEAAGSVRESASSFRVSLIRQLLGRFGFIGDGVQSSSSWITSICGLNDRIRDGDDHLILGLTSRNRDRDVNHLSLSLRRRRYTDLGGRHWGVLLLLEQTGSRRRFLRFVTAADIDAKERSLADRRWLRRSGSRNASLSRLRRRRKGLWLRWQRLNVDGHRFSRRKLLSVVRLDFARVGDLVGDALVLQRLVTVLRTTVTANFHFASNVNLLMMT